MPVPEVLYIKSDDYDVLYFMMKDEGREHEGSERREERKLVLRVLT